MRYLVTLRLEPKGAPKMVWPVVEVDGKDKWEALVKAAEKTGVAKLFNMSELWAKSSIVKKKRSSVRRWRRETTLEDGQV
jgi:hypothetical protein